MKGQATQHLWIDSTTLAACKNQRIQRHKSLTNLRLVVKDQWFYGFKLHIVMNRFGAIVCSSLSNCHVADIKMVEQSVEGFEARIYADRG